MFASRAWFRVQSTIGVALFSSFVATARGQTTVDRPMAVSAPNSAKSPIPDKQSLEKADSLLKEIYKEKLDAATSPNAQTQLAQELLNKVPGMRGDIPSCYALLREAGHLAFKARDYDLSLVVIDMLDKRFEVDALSLRTKVLVVECANPESSGAECCSLGIELMKEAAAKGRWEIALQVSELTEKAAQQVKSPVLVKYMEDCKARLEKASREKKAEADLLARLNVSPDNAEANLALGKLYCFVRGDWEKGIPMLALGSDATLKKLAQKELERPFDGENAMRLGDGWWDLAHSGAREENGPSLARAAYWYRLAQPQLTGLLQVKVEKRLAEIGPNLVAVKTERNLLPPLGAGGFALRGSGLRPVATILGGGTKQTERAVNAALVWLAKHQGYEGRWSLSDYTSHCSDKTCTGPGEVFADAGGTAMGLLPFLSAGHTHRSKGPYMDTVRRGIGWLIGHQQRDGNLAKGAQQMMYSHGLATIALCEAYGLTGDKDVGRAAQRAVNFILAAQNDADGGWRYLPKQPGDTSVVGWQLMALKSAHMAGLDVGGSVFSGVTKWLDLVSVNNGTEYCYQENMNPSPTMASVGLLCRQYLGAKRSNPMLTGGMSYLMNHLPDDRDFTNIYYLYYATQVMHNMSGSEWDAWNRKMRDLLVHTQVRDLNECAYGSWAPEKDPWGRRGGRVMQTSLSALTLEIYYRYAPLYGGDEAGATDRADVGGKQPAKTEGTRDQR